MHYDIFRLDIPMYHPTSMQFLHRRTYLFHQPCHFNLRHRFASFQLLVQLTTHTDLHYDIDVLLVIEKTVHFYDVWMVQKDLDLDLTDELLYYLLLYQHCLLDHLQSTYKT